MSPLFILLALFALLALTFFGFASIAFRHRHRRGGVAQTLLGVVFLLGALLLGAVALGMRGYQALTREVTAATLRTVQLAPQRFRAELTYPDGSVRSYDLTGDQIYVDAQILKWHPTANLIGLHTGYALDRIGGRYASLDDEQTQPRTVYTLSDPNPIDLFGVARRYPFLAPLVDAEYGSGTFVHVDDGGRYQIRVSTSGLLIRRIGPGD